MEGGRAGTTTTTTTVTGVTSPSSKSIDWDIMSDASLLLQQKLEFMQLELEDSKQRESRLQQLYETLLASMSAPAQVEPVDSAAIEERHRREMERVAEEARAKVRESQDQLRLIQDTHRECEFSLRTQKLSYEETILELKQQIYQLNNDKSHLSMKVKLLSSAAYIPI